jgi:VWFA-related protein
VDVPQARILLRGEAIAERSHVVPLSPFGRIGAVLAAGAAIAAAVPSVRGQSPSPKPEIPTFATGTDMVYVRFHIEKKGGYADAVKQDQIRVLEDGKPQAIALLETPSTRQRTRPPEVTLALDVSSSVLDEGLFDEALVKDVFLASLSEESRVGLCAFGGKLRCFGEPTREADELVGRLQEAIQFGHEERRTGTRLYASLADIFARKEGTEKTQRAVIVFSDGLDNQGGGVKEAIQAALAADVRVYAIMLSQAFQATSRNTGFGAPPGRAMYDYKKYDLDQLAKETGGKGYEPGKVNPSAMAKILREIATEISMENVVGYLPEGTATGRKRKVKVELVDKSLGAISDGERTLVR